MDCICVGDIILAKDVRLVEGGTGNASWLASVNIYIAEDQIVEIFKCPGNVY